MMCAVQLIFVISVPSDCLISFLNVCTVQQQKQARSATGMLSHPSAAASCHKQKPITTRSTRAGQKHLSWEQGAIPQLLLHPSGRGRRHAPCSPDQPGFAALPTAAGTSAEKRHPRNVIRKQAPQE
jgi:hypothetical protein|eukprot:COSAG02_NODE_1074_length_14765_cov_23.566685_11_plen_126_part_00